MELGGANFTKNLLINSLNRLPQRTDSNSKLSNPTNKPQICNSFCFQCPLKLDPIALTADMSIAHLKLKIGTNTVRLNNPQFRMLCAFKRYQNMVLSREFLFEYTWGKTSQANNNVNVMVSSLRSLLRHTELEIMTIRNKGYLLALKE
jgi:DNA-binding response OmpR family regulator